MTEFDLVVKHLQTQRNDAHNICANLMVTLSMRDERITELETELQNLKNAPQAKHKGKDDGNI